MSKVKKALTNHLVAAVMPHLTLSTEGNQPPKAVAKTARKLAKQVLKQQGKVAKLPTLPTTPTAKRARKTLAGELTATLQPYLNPSEAATTEGTSKAITKTIKRLASELVKQRRKQEKNVATGTPPAALAPESATSLTTRAIKAQPKRATPTPARRAAPTKRPVAKAAPASETVSLSTAGTSQD